MSNAERTIIVAVLAGAVAIGLYLRDRHRAGLLDWSRDLWSVFGMVAALGAFVLVLLQGASAAIGIVTPALALLAGIYVLRTARSELARFAGWALLAAAAAGLGTRILREIAAT